MASVLPAGLGPWRGRVVRSPLVFSPSDGAHFNSIVFEVIEI